MTFKSRLESVLRVRKVQEQQQAATAAAAQRALYDAEAKRAARQAHLESLGPVLGASSGADFELQLQRRISSAAALAQAASTVSTARMVRDFERQRLIEASQRKEGMARAVDREHEAFEEAERVTERKVVDDLVISRWARTTGEVRT